MNCTHIKVCFRNSLQETGTCMHLSECARMCMCMGGVYLKFLTLGAFSSSTWWYIILTSLLIRHSGKNNHTASPKVCNFSFCCSLVFIFLKRLFFFFWDILKLNFLQRNLKCTSFHQVEYGNPLFFCHRKKNICVTTVAKGLLLLLLFSILSDDRSNASSKMIPPHSVIQSLLFQMRVSSPVLKVIQ